MATTPTNLSEYYKSKNQALPSVQDRGKIFESYGLGSAKDYVGSADQNISLLSKLQPSDSGPKVSEIDGVGTLTVTDKGGSAGTPGVNKDENIDGLYARTGVTPPPPLASGGNENNQNSLVPVYGTKYQGNPVIGSINNLALELDKISSSIISSKTASEEEKQLARDLLNKKAGLESFDTETLKRIEAYSGQGRGQTREFVSLNQEKERKIRALERLGLAQDVQNISDQLGLAKEERLAQGTIAETQYNLAKSKTDLAMGIYKEMERLDEKSQDEARTYLLDLVDFAKGKTFEELDRETQNQIIASVADSPITLGMVKNALSSGAKPEKISTSIVETGGVKKLINDQTGETIRVLGQSDDSVDSITSFSNILTKQQIYALRASGFADQTINDVTRWVISGMTLDDIRSALDDRGFNPQILDIYDRVVNINGLKNPSNTQFKNGSSSGGSRSLSG